MRVPAGVLRSISICFILGLLTLPGCQVVGLVLDRVSGDPVVPATYVPTKDVMLVMVESYRNPASVSITGEQLDRLIVDELVAHKVAPIVNPDRLYAMRQTNPKEFEQMDTAAIGRRFGATQVLYADVVSFLVEPALGSHMIKSTAEVRVRVIDAATGHTLWPIEESGGHPIRFQTPFIALKEGMTEDAVREKVTHTLSDEIAKLFYNYTQESPDGSESTLGT